MDSAQNFVVWIDHIKEHNRFIGETHCECMLVRTEFESENCSNALNVLDPLHSLCFIHPNAFHVLLEKDDFVDLRKEMDFLNELIVDFSVFDTSLNILQI